MKVGRKIIVVCVFRVHARNVCIVLSRMPLKPNSITLAGSELVRSWFKDGSNQIA